MTKYVRKTEGKEVRAYQLGSNSFAEEGMKAVGKIVSKGNGIYEIFSQECRGDKGEKAKTGDYFKIDSKGFPYPNEKNWFEENHRAINVEQGIYEQIPKPLLAWELGDAMIPEVQYLLDTKKLVINEENKEETFGATLWGAWETAAYDAVVIFYSVEYDNGEVIDCDFNFIARDEFQKVYYYC